MYKTNFGFTRFLLSLLVALAHVQNNIDYNHLLDYGRLSVLIFFILSGIIISKASSNFYLNKPFAFLINRIITLVPPIIIIICIVSLFFYILKENSEISEYKNLLTNLYGWFPGKFLLDHFFLGKNQIEIIPILWTIRIEFLFYFFIFFYLLINFYFKLSIHNYKVFILINLILILLFMLGFLFIKNLKLSEYMGYFVYFLIGCFIYKIFELNKKNYLVLFMKCLVALIIGILSFYQCSQNIRPIDGYFYQEVNFTMFLRSIFVLVFVYFSIFRNCLYLIPEKLSKFLGGVSYYIYLMHFPIYNFFWKYFEFNFLFYFIFLVVVSIVFFSIYDFLIKDFKNKIRGTII